MLQARADLSVARPMPNSRKSRRALAVARQHDAVARQDVDQRTFTWNANLAQVKAAQANVDRLVARRASSI